MCVCVCVCVCVFFLSFSRCVGLALAVLEGCWVMVKQCGKKSVNVGTRVEFETPLKMKMRHGTALDTWDTRNFQVWYGMA